MDSKTIAIKPDEGLRRRRRAPVRFPLVLKLFLLTALLVVIVAGLSIGVTVDRANRIAKLSVDDSISRAGGLFEDLEARRLKDLSLGVLTLARDPAFYAYIERAISGGEQAQAGTPAVAPAPQAPAPAAPEPSTPPVDLASIIDQLIQRKELLGTDLLLLTDDQGLLLSRTDSADITGRRKSDLYAEQPLLKELIDNPPAPDPVIGAPRPVTGTMLLDNRLYQAALVPLAIGGRPPIGYLINAYRIDETFANHISAAANAEVIFLPATESGEIARSTNAPSAASVRGMAEMHSVMGVTGRTPPRNVTIDNSSYVMTGEPLISKGKPVGAAIFVRSLDRELAPFRRIEQTLLLAGGGALLLAFILSWLIARRLTRPIEQLADMAQAVTEGDYGVRPEMNRSDEVGILAGSFASMISALRDKAELEELYEQVAVRERERIAAPAAAFHRPRSEEGTILVTDLRGMPSTVGDGEASSVIDRVGEIMRLQEAEVLRQEGQVREIVGHRLVSTFSGDRGITHAIRTARAISEEMALRATPELPLGAGFGIATGEYVTGSVDVRADSGLAMIGNAPLLALLFAWEAPTGVAYISLESAQAGESDLLAAGHREEVRLRWLPAPLQAVALPLRSVTTGIMPSLVRQDGVTMRLDSRSGASAPSDLAPGFVFASRYQIEQVLGRGGMGVVYKANDRQLDETVAIKTLDTGMLSRSPEHLERFKREIRLARRITHRNVLRTYDYGEADGMYFISMEYVKGYTLAELMLKNSPMARRTALGVARQICRGLQAAHEEGIIHRDIKPQNVLVDHRGEVKLMDFGIARMAEAPDAMTGTGIIVGTPHYMSPEQVQAKQLDARSDVYSMGVVLYEMLCGEPPFNAPSLTAVLTAHLTQTPRAPIEIRPEIGSDLNRVVLRCLAKEPHDRYADAGKLLRELDGITTEA